MITDLSLPETLMAVAAGIGLAAAVGFRIFVPMLLMSLAAQAGLVSLADGFAWLGADIALTMLSIAALVEIAAYFVPFFDHLLDVISGPVAVAAGTLLMASTLVDMAPWLRWVLALIAGGGTAGVVHVATASLRLGSSVTTGGLANPVLAGAELGTATVLTVLAITVPLLALFVVGFVIFRITRRWRRKANPAGGAAK